MRFLNLTAVFTCLLLLNSSAVLMAHEGHGVPTAGDGLLHYLVNPSHAIPLVLISVAVIWLARRLLNSISEQAH
ncbi:MAG: hypothetical protein RL215_539 [Planctomycetota bacterium]|jgi:hypothetical protein